MEWADDLHADRQVGLAHADRCDARREMESASDAGPEQHLVIGYGAAVDRDLSFPRLSLLHMRQGRGVDHRAQQHVPVAEKLTPNTADLEAVLIQMQPLAMGHVHGAL